MPQDNTPSPTPSLSPDQLPGNPPDLTEAERAALEGFDEDGNEIAPASATPPAEGAGAAAEGAAVAEPPAAAGPDSTATPAAETTPPAAAPAAQPAASTLPTLADDGRDFKAELEGLKERYSKDEIDDDAYQEAREEIIVARARAETRAELSTAFSQHTWVANATAFLARPENAILLRSPEMQDVWANTMQTAVNNAGAAGKPLTDDFQIMEAGRDLLFQQLGISAAVTPPEPSTPAAGAPPPAQPRNAPPLDKLPPSLSGAPAAAASGAKATAESLAGLDIEALEHAMINMSEAQQEELLRSVPGAFVD